MCKILLEKLEFAKPTESFSNLPKLQPAIPGKPETLRETMRRRVLEKSQASNVPSTPTSAEIVFQAYLDEPLLGINMTDEEFLKTPPNILEYWQEKSKSNDPYWRELANLARHYLTPPPTSVDVERLFATLADILTSEKNRTLPENGNMLLFLRENLPQLFFKY